MHRLFAVSTAALSFALLAGCSSSTAAPGDQVAHETEKLVSYWRDMSFNFCDWDHHPDRSVCHTSPSFPVTPGEPMCPLDSKDHLVLIDEPPPPGSILPGVSLVFAIDPSSTCGLSQTYPDGAQIYGGSARCGVLRDHVTYEQLGPVLFTKSANQMLARMDGFYDNIKSDDIKVTASFGFHDSPPVADGDIVVDILTLRADGQWVVRSSYSSVAGQTGVRDAAVRLDPNTSFRVEIHTGNIQGSRTVWLDNVKVSVPECIPDQANPGQCL